ncbi:MAG: hypothetical protein LUG99_15820 [Lachnospiraceae bacterium]|nr:hypothetical protein [Lachnospiraceae bacterium]
MSGLRYQLAQKCLDPNMDDHSRDTYLRGIKRFEDYAKENGISQRKAIKGAKKHDLYLLQDYSNWLVLRGYTAATVHTYLTPICKAFGVSMDKIDKPPRISSHTTKGRVETKKVKNPQGVADLTKEKYHRITEFASAVGIRRSEYGKLLGKDIIYDNDGMPIGVQVRSGKGGKDTINYILPQHQETVARIVKGIRSDEKIFTDHEMKTKANLHQYRRLIATEAYQYYHSFSPEDREKLKQDLIDTYISTKKGVTKEKVNRFKRELEKGDYILRGANAAKARQEGRPLRYDRVSLYAISCYHLAHYRLDVTVNNYLQ